MSTIGLWLLGTGLATLGVSASSSLADYILPRARERRLAQALPPTKIAGARAGEIVKIVGRLEKGPNALEAPLSGRACAHYVARVDLRRRTGWRKLAEEVKTRPFFVVDDTGRAEVDVARARVDVAIDHLWNARDVGSERRFELERFLFELKIPATSLLGGDYDLRYAEGALEEGEEVTVVGIASWSAAAEPGLGYRDRGKRLGITSPRRRHLFVSDAMHFTPSFG